MFEYVKPNGFTGKYDIHEYDFSGAKIKVSYSNDPILTEKYRPRILEDLVLPKEIKNRVAYIIEQQNIPNIIFYSSNGGTGKDSIISVLTAQVKMEMYSINCSLDRGLDIVRDEIYTFVRKRSFTGFRKVCYLTEIGGMSKTALDSLKVIVEEFSHYASFVLSTNTLSSIPQPLLTRFEVHDLSIIPSEERKSLARETLLRLIGICNKEGIKEDTQALSKLIIRYFPYYRELLIALQKSVINGIIQTSEDASLEHLNRFINVINRKDYVELVKLGREVNVYSILTQIKERYYHDFINDPSMYVTLIPAMEELNRAIQMRVPFLEISFVKFGADLMTGDVKIKEQKE
jgi:replication-associated recombination protein RarA